jgi:hypothetical protein
MNALTFKVYEFDGHNYNELGTVLHEDTLSRIAKRLSQAELNTLFVQTLFNDEPCHRDCKKGEFYIAPLKTWI